MWGLSFLNKGLVALGLTAAGIVILGLLVWRLSVVSDQLAVERRENQRYEAAFKAMAEADALRSQLSLADSRDTLAIERTRAEEIGLIEGTRDEEDGPVAPVLAATIERLFRDHPGTGSD